MSVGKFRVARLPAIDVNSVRNQTADGMARLMSDLGCFIVTLDKSAADMMCNTDARPAG